MNQQGVTFLEVIVVVAILLIVSSLVSPNIQDWRQKKALEADFNSILSKIEYVKIRSRVLGGPGSLTIKQDGLVYSVSVITVNGIKVVEDSSKLGDENSFSGKSRVTSVSIDFMPTGLIDEPKEIDVVPLDRNNIRAYKIKLSQTGFVEKFREQTPNCSGDCWVVLR